MHQDASNELLKTTVLGGGSKVTHMTSRAPSYKPKTDLSTESTQNERIQPGMVDLNTFCQFVSIYCAGPRLCSKVHLCSAKFTVVRYSEGLCSPVQCLLVVFKMCTSACAVPSCPFVQLFSPVVELLPHSSLSCCHARHRLEWCCQS